MRGVGKMSSSAAGAAAPALERAAPDLRVRGLAELSPLPTTASRRFPPGGSPSAALSLTHETRLPAKGASGRSSVTAHAAPGAAGNLLPRWTHSPATREDGGLGARRLVLPGSSRHQTGVPGGLPQGTCLRAARETWSSAPHLGPWFPPSKKQATIKWTFHHCRISHTLNFWPKDCTISIPSFLNKAWEQYFLK